MKSFSEQPKRSLNSSGVGPSSCSAEKTHEASGGTRAWWTGIPSPYSRWMFRIRPKREWLRGYARGVLLKRFRQKAIYLKFIGPVETLLVTDEDVASDS